MAPGRAFMTPRGYTTGILHGDPPRRHRELHGAFVRPHGPMESLHNAKVSLHGAVLSLNDSMVSLHGAIGKPLQYHDDVHCKLLWNILRKPPLRNGDSLRCPGDTVLVFRAALEAG
jgi:hypothetical protein